MQATENRMKRMLFGQLGLLVDISERIKPEFEILPKRWVVERTIAWFGNSRRLSKDYEITIESEEAFCLYRICTH